MGVYTGYTAIMDMMQYDRGIEKYLSEIELPDYAIPQILDIGCGSGVASLALAKRFPNARILTTDINQKFAQDTLKKLKSRGHRDAEAALLNVSTPRISAVLRQTGNHVGRILEQDSFDIVMMGGVLCYSEDVKNSIEEIGILLKENGTLINLEMKSDGNIPEFISRVYQYDRRNEEDIADLAQVYIGDTTIIPLTSHYFPVNLTRTSIISTKK